MLLQKLISALIGLSILRVLEAARLGAQLANGSPLQPFSPMVFEEFLVKAPGCCVLYKVKFRLGKKALESCL